MIILKNCILLLSDLTDIPIVKDSILTTDMISCCSETDCYQDDKFIAAGRTRLIRNTKAKLSWIKLTMFHQHWTKVVQFLGIEMNYV